MEEAASLVCKFCRCAENIGGVWLQVGRTKVGPPEKGYATKGMANRPSC